VLLENLTALVLWLLVTVLWVNAVFLAFLIHRRVSRKRYFIIKDEARARYRRIIDQLNEGKATFESATAMLASAKLEPEIEAVHDLLLPKMESEDVTKLLYGIGSIERWARVAFGRNRCGAIVDRAMSGESNVHKRAKQEVAWLHPGRFRVTSVDRARAMSYLGRLYSPVALIFASEGLHDPAPEVRRIAMTALGRNRHPSAIPLIMEELDSTVSRGGQEISFRSARAALVSYPIQHLAAFAPFLRHKHPRVRFAVIDAIRDICQRTAATTMVTKNDFPIEIYNACVQEMVKDSYVDVRARVAGIIRYFRDAPALDALKSLMNDENEFVRLHAVRASGDRHLVDLVPSLAERLDDDSWRVCEATIKSLLVFGDKGQEVLFHHFIASESEHACEQLADELQRSGIVSSLLATCARDGHFDRTAAVFRKLTMLQKDTMLLHAIASPDLDAAIRLNVLNVLMIEPRDEVVAAVELVAQTDSSVVGQRATALLADREQQRGYAAGAN
jgi:HEAT repeat protein